MPDKAKMLFEVHMPRVIDSLIVESDTKRRCIEDEERKE